VDNCCQLLTDGSYCVLPVGHYQSEPDDDHENRYGVSLMAMPPPAVPAMTRVRAEQQDRRAVIEALEAWEDACTRAHRPDGRATLLNTALLITAGDTLRNLLLGQLERGTS
jgi:hypothetical protein